MGALKLLLLFFTGPLLCQILIAGLEDYQGEYGEALRRHHELIASDHFLTNFKENKIPYPNHYPELFLTDYAMMKNGEVQWDFYLDDIRGAARTLEIGLTKILGGDVIALNPRESLVSPLNSDPMGKELNAITNTPFIWVDSPEQKERIISQYTDDGWKALILGIRPHYLNDIFVAEMKHYEKKDGLPSLRSGRSNTLRGLEVVSLAKYIEEGMGFEKPQYLIGKPIRASELTTFEVQK